MHTLIKLISNTSVDVHELDMQLVMKFSIYQLDVNLKWINKIAILFILEELDDLMFYLFLYHTLLPGMDSPISPN